ncbi:MAG: YvcK family protein [Clostridia bacterium]|nr:YvcK family protein [Clostridia bacterium]
MSNNFLEWFGSGLRIKRWIFLVVLGTVLLAYGFASILTLETMEVSRLIVIGFAFVLGIAAIVTGFIMAQRRILQAVAEANVGMNPRNLNIKKLVYDKRMLDKSVKIVVIGGGTGLSTILRGLKSFSNNITAIVTTATSSIKQDLVAKEFGILAPNDLRQSLVALSNKENVMEELMQYQFKNGNLKGYSFGNLLLVAMNDICEGNFAKAIQDTSKVLSITGRVLPATLDATNIGAVLTDGTRVLGEENISQIKKSPIEKIFLSPERCTPAPGVISSIKEADVIIIGPGSLYTGIIPNLLIREIADEVKKSNATKIMISNIMTEPGETDNFKVSDCITAIYDHVGKGVIDYCIANDSDIMPEYVRRYNSEGADIMEIDKNNIKAKGVNLVVDDFAVIDEKGNIRHDPDKLANAVMKIVCDNMDLTNSKQALEYHTIKAKIKKMRRRKKKKSILFNDVKIVANGKKSKGSRPEQTEIPIVGQKK